MKSVNYAQIFEVYFSAPATKRKKKKIKNVDHHSSTLITASLDIQPSETELEQLYDALLKTAEKPALLSITPDYCDQYVYT